jgi:hypothetical protein
MDEEDVVVLSQFFSDFVLTDVKNTVCILIAPSIGLRPLSGSLHGERDALQRWEKELKNQALGLEVGSFVCMMNPATRYSADTSCAKSGLMMFSNQKEPCGRFTSIWHKSALYKSEAVLEVADFQPRGSFVNPCHSLLQGNKVTSGSTAQEIRQRHSGAGFYKPLLRTLLKEMPCTPPCLMHSLVAEDFDGTYTESAIELMKDPPNKEKVPMMMTTCSLITQGGKNINPNIVSYCQAATAHAIKDQAVIIVA